MWVRRWCLAFVAGLRWLKIMRGNIETARLNIPHMSSTSLDSKLIVKFNLYI